MSSLIVADVALAYPDNDSPGQSYFWIEKRIREVLSSAERRFEALVQKNERIIRLHDELSELAEKILILIILHGSLRRQPERRWNSFSEG
jgi:hypothetical protein